MTVAGLWRPSRHKNVTSQAVRTESALSGTEATNFPVAGTLYDFGFLRNVIQIEANRGNVAKKIRKFSAVSNNMDWGD